ncbi:MAG TPA: hypothetical protein VFB79_05855 [Candidatus Angelobacter sp.]|nr:hypothetical protein [Candidatus Angelobacter sp.]
MKSITNAILVTLLAICSARQDAPAPIVSISHAVVSRAGMLSCEWSIRNEGSKLLFVYASYLRGSADDMTELLDQRTLLIKTTWLKEVAAYPAYYVPKLEILRVEPGTQITGHLERQLKSPLRAISTVKLVVGVGIDDQQLVSNVEETLKKGIEFQGNPIVRWQLVTFSKSIPVEHRYGL